VGHGGCPGEDSSCCGLGEQHVVQCAPGCTHVVTQPLTRRLWRCCACCKKIACVAADIASRCCTSKRHQGHVPARSCAMQRKHSNILPRSSVLAAAPIMLTLLLFVTVAAAASPPLYPVMSQARSLVTRLMLAASSTTIALVGAACLTASATQTLWPAFTK
jgi:hypothetical protein